MPPFLRARHIYYLMAKQGLAFSRYPALLELEGHHGIDLGVAYSTPDSAKTFTGYIAKSQRQSFINNSNITLF